MWLEACEARRALFRGIAPRCIGGQDQPEEGFLNKTRKGPIHYY